MRSTFRTALFAAAASFALGAAAPSFAQYVADEIVVTPYGVESRTVGRTSSGIPIEENRLSRVVTTADLDLRTDWGVQELHRRIADTARLSCRDLERMSSGPALTSEAACIRDAMRDAEPQVEAAVWRARSYAALK